MFLDYSRNWTGDCLPYFKHNDLVSAELEQGYVISNYNKCTRAGITLVRATAR